LFFFNIVNRYCLNGWDRPDFVHAEWVGLGYYLQIAWNFDAEVYGSIESRQPHERRMTSSVGKMIAASAWL
jgi:hypothetical protein